VTNLPRENESRSQGVSPFPLPQNVRIGDKIRWAVGDPDGRRSQSWTVFGSRNSNDFYVGPRFQVDRFKVSLHESGKWRLAWADEFAPKLGLPEGQDRVLQRWRPPAGLATGLDTAATVVITTDRLSTHPPEKRQGKVSFYPRPDPSVPLAFYILVSSPNRSYRVNAVPVGYTQLPDGRSLVVACLPIEAEQFQMRVAAARAAIEQSITLTKSPPSQALFFDAMESGAPLIMDLGVLAPPGSADMPVNLGEIVHGQLIRRDPPTGPSATG
jgi:hypothetical protein